MICSRLLFRKQMRKQKRQATAFPDYAQVRNILLLFESDKAEANLTIQEIIRQLYHEGKSVDALGYLLRGESITAKSEHYRILDKNDITLIGSPKNSIAEKWQQRHYDLLLDLTLSPILPLQYIAMMANADFKAGRATTAPYLSDFMIQIEGQPDAKYLFEQIKYYLQQIQTQDL